MRVRRSARVGRRLRRRRRRAGGRAARNVPARRGRAHPATSAPGLGIRPSTSAPGLRSPGHICARTGLTPPARYGLSVAAAESRAHTAGPVPHSGAAQRRHVVQSGAGARRSARRRARAAATRARMPRWPLLSSPAGCPVLLCIARTYNSNKYRWVAPAGACRFPHYIAMHRASRAGRSAARAWSTS